MFLEPILVTILKEIRYYVLDICNDKFLICAMVNKNIIIFNFNTKILKENVIYLRVANTQQKGQVKFIIALKAAHYLNFFSF